MKFLKDFKMFSILENKKQALSILRKNNINSDNSDYIEIYQNLEDNFFNLNLLGLLTKYRFIQDVSQDEILDLIRWLSENNGNKLLSKPILKYDKFQDLKDEILDIDKMRKIKLIINKLPHHQKYLYKNATLADRKIFDDWCVKMFEIKYQEPFFRKISKIKSMTELIDHISQFVEQNLNIKSFREKIKEIESTEGADIYKIDEENGIICAVIHDYNASSKLGSRAWCISTSIGSWRNYNSERKSTIQYFIWNYSLSISDPLFMIGVTVSINDTIKNIHDNNDNSLNSLINYRDKKVKFVLDLNLKGMSYDEFLQRIETEREKRRKENKDIYEESPELLKLANALKEFLIVEGIWLNVYDTYDIKPTGHDYSLSIFEIELPNDKMEFSIGTDEEADKSAYESIKYSLDDYGYELYDRVKYHVNNEELANSIIEEEIEHIRSYTNDVTSYIEEEGDDGNLLVMKDDKMNLYKKLNKIKDELEERLSDLNIKEIEYLDSIKNEIKNLKSDKEKNWEIDESLVEKLIKETSEEIKYDPIKYIEDNFDYDTLFDKIYDFIDVNDYVYHIIAYDGRGSTLSYYDGCEYYILYEGEEYYIYRID